MELRETSPLPEVCQECERKGEDLDCFTCENGGLRFSASEIDSLLIKRTSLYKRIDRDLKTIRTIESKLESLGYNLQGEIVFE